MVAWSTNKEIKLWAILEVKTGNVYCFQVYLVKVEGALENSLAKRGVVRHLTVTEHNKKHYLYMDNFYSPLFFQEVFFKCRLPSTSL